MIRSSELLDSVLKGDVRSIARAITLVENHSPEGMAFLQQLFPHTGIRKSSASLEVLAPVRALWSIASRLIIAGRIGRSGLSPWIQAVRFPVAPFSATASE